MIWHYYHYTIVVYQLLVSSASDEFVCASGASEQIQPATNVKTNTGAHSDRDVGRSPPYWPRYSGTRRVKLLDGIWNSSRLETCNGFGTESVECDDDALPRMGSCSICRSINNKGVTSFDSMDPNIDISKIHTNELVAIPSTIEVVADPEHGYLPGYMGYRGVSFFRTHFDTFPTAVKRSAPRETYRFSASPAARIQFQACSFYCRVWLNGVELGDHIAGGYVAWWLDVSEEVLELGRRHEPQQISQQKQEHSQMKKEHELIDSNSTPGNTIILTHELFILVDNRFNSTTAPLHTGGDFWHYGGIMRSVEWHDRPNIFLFLKMAKKKQREKKMNSNVGKYAREPSRVESLFVGEENKNNMQSQVTKLETISQVPKSIIDSKYSLTRLQHHIMVWPWRLYVVPQKDLRSVNLSLQLVSDSGGEEATDLWNELRRKNQVKIYFDGNATVNELDNNFMATGKIILTQTQNKLQTPSPKMKRPNASRRGSDQLLELGKFWVPNPRIWSTSDPQLHTVSVDLNGAIVTERFGLRFWDTSTSTGDTSQARETSNETRSVRANNTSASSRIRLNGRVLKLLGWNLHTQWPYTAASPTDEQLDKDIRLLKEIGHANFLRGAHYPQDPRWLDRLDEHGIMVWCETLGPGVSVANLHDDYFLESQNRQVNEMLDNAFNHPSIAFWGFFNEGPSNHEEACEGYQVSSDAISARDTSRFITYASSHRPPNDKCYGTATVISYNGYPGWYDHLEPEEYWNSLVDELGSGRYPDAVGKPILISETGAGGIYEWKDNRTAVKWTLGYQADIISRDVATAINNTNLSGIALWHLFDFKVDDRWEENTHCDYLPEVLPKTCGYIDVDVDNAGGRPGGANHKGSVDFFRRPKPVFGVVSSQYKSQQYEGVQ